MRGQAGLKPRLISRPSADRPGMAVPVVSREPIAPSIRFSIGYVPFGMFLREKLRSQQSLDPLPEPTLHTSIDSTRAYRDPRRCTGYRLLQIREVGCCRQPSYHWE